MPDNSAAIVIDIGTTNCKVTCFSCQDATTLGALKFVTPKNVSPQGAVDFDIERLWQEVILAMTRLTTASPLPVTCISIASFGESGVFIDEKGEILTPMLAWYDRRGEEYLNTLNEEASNTLYEITGLPVHSNYSAFKMRWLLEHHLLHDRNDIRWLHAPEVLLWRLTGQQRTDITLASRTLCLDVRKGTWSQEAAALLCIPFSVFAPLVQPGEPAGWVSETLRQQLGFASPVSVALAGHDHMVGARALQMVPGDILNSTGTTEGILQLDTQPTLDEQARRDKLANGRYSLRGQFTLFASLPVGGYALEWLRNTFRLTEEEIATSLNRGYHDYLAGRWNIDELPVFIPHLRGSGSPFKNRHTRGLFYGLGDHLNVDTLIASVSLGLTMEFANCFSCFNVPTTSAMKVIGPATENPLWLQLKADILQRPVEAIAFQEAVSVGALLTACPTLSSPEINVGQRYLPDRVRYHSLQRFQQKWKTWYRLKLQQEGIIQTHIREEHNAE
ncbi:carbohydrate kinase [Citrobacter amalonaticus]|uniref:Carbohydrate kinase n=1 Tax=Citrobacter amalonaticus TaxID=35703 RepID=A0A2S4RUX0_CITAM|nr:FGGY-family carbohydrate kinase [Citrobacter amalonaticus]POT55509.1 carbohydrate kinase [Citrobacter amalonaticus]POT73720.1 carbohydrate kinase [Citrobacter amalonaticus]POU63945.1 carbohydrate kinase [Citrobacter amalonaticus]POV03578.1 carbohydrate kinase [Citrobacter amalonaticus]